MAAFSGVPAAIGAGEDSAVGTQGIGAPGVQAQQFADAPGKPTFAATGFADQEQRTKSNGRATGKVAQGKVDDLAGVGKFEKQPATDLLKRGAPSSTAERC
jgi:hypothetical protein